jgi:hypothetical protein
MPHPELRPTCDPTMAEISCASCFRDVQRHAARSKRLLRRLTKVRWPTSGRLASAEIAGLRFLRPS